MNPRFTGKKHSKEAIRKIVAARKRSWRRGDYENAAFSEGALNRVAIAIPTKIHRKKISEALKGRKKTEEHCLAMRKGHDNEATRKKHSLASKRLWKNLSHQKIMAEALSKLGWTSKIQISVFKSLCRKGFEGIRLNYRVDRKIVDIAFPSIKLAIEIDGLHWHKNKIKKRNRDQYLRRRGWSIKHFVIGGKNRDKKRLRKSVIRFLEAA